VEGETHLMTKIHKNNVEKETHKVVGQRQEK